MTADELKAEWLYRYEERLALLCGEATPSPELMALARIEADRAIRVLTIETIRGNL
jgi:hypothetical protein